MRDVRHVGVQPVVSKVQERERDCGVDDPVRGQAAHSRGASFFMLLLGGLDRGRGSRDWEWVGRVEWVSDGSTACAVTAETLPAMPRACRPAMAIRISGEDI